jgi:hypothetical protein
MWRSDRSEARLRARMECLGIMQEKQPLFTKILGAI